MQCIQMTSFHDSLFADMFNIRFTLRMEFEYFNTLISLIFPLIWSFLRHKINK